MKQFSQIITRLVLLTLIAVIFFIGYKVFLSKPDAILSVNQVSSQISGFAKNINLGPTVNGLLTEATRKLTDSQPIIQTSSTLKPQVEGASTDVISEQVKNAAQTAANQIMNQVKDLPKKEAARVTRQVCDQIVSQLEKQ